MKEQRASQLHDFLLSQESAAIKTWFDRKHKNNSDYPSDPNWWVGIAISLLHQSQEQEPWDLARLKISIDIYVYLGDYSSLLSAMLIRITVINKLGRLSESEAEDIEAINDYFFAHLKISLAEAKYKANLFSEDLVAGDPYQHLSNDEILELRRIKERLNVIQSLRSEWLPKSNIVIYDWMQIKQTLP
jgi:hypothetical protein